jgi:hypothetical protein
MRIGRLQFIWWGIRNWTQPVIGKDQYPSGWKLPIYFCAWIGPLEIRWFT